MTIKNRKFLDTYQGVPCFICKKDEGTVGHHLKTKGSGGPDEAWNLIPVCGLHHHEVHKIGLPRFAAKYNIVKVFLELHDWWFCTITRRWKR